jgi:four helix bundle protein
MDLANDPLAQFTLEIASKEQSETVIWLETGVENSVLSAEKVAASAAENRQLCRIIVASIKTVRVATNEPNYWEIGSLG